MLKQLPIKLFAAVLVLILSVASYALDVGPYKIPEGPHPQMTPGSLCANSTTYRYPEHIKYCDRSVSTGTKNRIIQQYDQKLGFDIEKLPRGDFKIDHFIPLSIGGANDISNLWPQHKSIYAYSDPLEADVFTLISAGKIKQAEAVSIIKECKLNLGRCAELGDYLKSMLK